MNRYNKSGCRDDTAYGAITEADKIIKFTIPLSPVTKKNSQRIFFKKASKSKIFQMIHGRLQSVIPFVAPSEKYRDYEAACGWHLKPWGIDKPVNVKAVYYMPTRHRVDLINLHSALHDVLVKYKVVEDDNSKIIKRTDGSEVRYDKNNLRTEVFITFLVNTEGADN